MRRVIFPRESVWFFSFFIFLGIGLLASGLPIASAESAESLEEAFVRVAKEVGPSVVNISTVHTERVGWRYHFGDPFGGRDRPYDPFEEFFRDFFGDLPEREFQKRGLGSGVILDPNGFILTNAHVVEEADEITVILPDGRKFEGVVQGTDPRSDLAILRIDAKNLPAAKLGDSDKVQIGQWMIAIGNPFGHLVNNPEPTVTVGVVSATGRALPRVAHRDRNYTDLIQTDAAINPGNSGGPLVNLKGEVVGINVAIFSTTGGYQGIGFAIPINSAKRIMTQLIEGRKITYGWLGVHIQDIDDDLRRYFSLPDRKGVLVAGILQGGPAEKAGMREGDVIHSLQDQPVENSAELIKRIGETPVGKTVTLGILREGKSISLQVKVGERPEEGAAREISTQESWRGLIVQEITPSLQRRGIEERKGVFVRQVEPGSPADRAGLREGDILHQINRDSIESLEDFYKVIGTVRGDCLVRTRRGFAVLKEK